MELKFLIACLATIFYCFGQVSSDESVDNYVTMVLENFSEAMRTGVPVLGIPVLDPINIDYVTIPEISYPKLKLKANASENVVAGQSYYTPAYVHMDLQNMSSQITLNLSAIKIDGLYWCDGMLMFIFPIFGEGFYNLNVTEIVLDCIGGIYLIDGGYMQLTNVDTSIEFNAIELYLDNFLGGGSFGDEISEAISQLGTLIFEAIMPYLEETLIPVLVDYINQALMQHTLEDILQGALPTPPKV